MIYKLSEKATEKDLVNAGFKERRIAWFTHTYKELIDINDCGTLCIAIPKDVYELSLIIDKVVDMVQKGLVEEKKW